MQGWKDASDAPVLQMRRFPARVEVSQSLQIKFPVPLRREFRCKSPNLARVFDASKGRIPCKLQKIPCKFPYIREFSREDQFVGDCIHSQPVRSLWGHVRFTKIVATLPTIQWHQVRHSS